jgi:2-polyprenyl-3-methyl-5-hydroxy-6-metoxy-1,4-benzoquinol methylase
MVIERSRRTCVLCGSTFTGRTFLCRACSDRYRNTSIPAEVRARFYRGVDEQYPEWANTYGNYNPPRGLLDLASTIHREARVLELGAGGGYLLEDLWAIGFRRLVGTDITPTALREMAKRKMVAARVAADGETLPFRAGTFDVIIASDVLEHLPDLDRHLTEVGRVLSPHGQYLIKTPNRSLASAYYRLRGLHDAHFWHPSMVTAGELRRTLDRHGFDCRFLPVPALTDAQARKVPLVIARHALRRLPLGRVPVALRPHLEVQAVFRR